MVAAVNAIRAERAAGGAATGSGMASGPMQQAGRQEALQQLLTGIKWQGSTEHLLCSAWPRALRMRAAVSRFASRKSAGFETAVIAVGFVLRSEQHS